MEVYSATYTLTPLRGLNSRVASEGRPGALLMVVDDDGAVGFSDLHPWTELGDVGLDEQLRLLSQGQITPLSARSLRLAALDREARRNKTSAFAGLEIPKSHYLVTDLRSASEDGLRAAMMSGFEAIKVKTGRDVAAEIEILKKWSGLFAQGLKLRLDFNGVMTESGFMAFMKALPTDVARAIEFVEDPVPWGREAWSKLARVASLAIDRASDLELSDIANGNALPFEWLIIKPAIQDPERIARIARASRKKIAVTSYMDHPIGQVGAALEAARLVSIGVSGSGSGTSLSMGHGGFSSHLAFEKNVFSERLVLKEARLVVPFGTGIGFDDLLSAQAWKRVL